MTIKTILLAATFSWIIIIFSASGCAAWKGMGGQAVDGHGSMPPGHSSSATPLKDMSITGHKESRQQVVALVNAHEITMGRLMDSMREIIMSKYGHQKITRELARRIRHETLEKLAMEELAYQHAIQSGIVPDKKLIAKKLAAVKKSAGGEEAFLKELAAKNKTEQDVEREITYFIAIKEIIDREINQGAEVSREEIDKTYQANRNQFITPERVVITDVVFFLDPGQPESLEKVKKVRRKIISELDNDPARLHPDGFAVTAGLDVSPDYKPEHYNAARAMKKGELSQPLIIDDTFHLIKFVNYQARSEKNEAEAKKIVAGKIKSIKIQQRLAQWRQKLMQDADIQIVHDLLKDN